MATPIGNLEDITLRALRTLSEVSLIAAEDTRRTRVLLDRHSISTRTISYHEHNKEKQIGALLEALEAGSVALVTDAGTPGLSDPGYLLVQAALAEGHQVTPIPGPSAAMAALVASGLPTDAFIFLGYLPRKPAERRRELGELAEERRTMVFFEAPHRLAAALADLEEFFGGDRPMALCRELTKAHEEILRAPLQDIRVRFETDQPKGEITLVIGGAPPRSRWDAAEVRQAMVARLAEGVRPTEAARQVAHESGWPRSEVYRMALEDR